MLCHQVSTVCVLNLISTNLIGQQMTIGSAGPALAFEGEADDVLHRISGYEPFLTSILPAPPLDFN